MPGRSRFLCSVLKWEQGDFIDDAGLGSGIGFGADAGLAPGRHVRSNYDNYTKVTAKLFTADRQLDRFVSNLPPLAFSARKPDASRRPENETEVIVCSISHTSPL